MVDYSYDNGLNDYLLDAIGRSDDDNNNIGGQSDEIGGADAKKSADNDRLPGSEIDFPPEEPQEIDPQLEKDDLAALVISHIKNRNFSDDAINSMDTFYYVGIPQIISQIFKIDIPRIKNERKKTDEDKSIAYFGFRVEFTDTHLSRPMYVTYKTQKEDVLYPNKARVSDLTYSAPLYVDIRATKIAVMTDGKVKEETKEIKNVKIANIPVMVKSKMCNLYKAPREMQTKLEESPNNPGGSFIIAGKDWNISMLENLKMNAEYVFKNNYQRELARLTFLSKPGDAYENSQYFVIHLLNDNQLNVVITTNKSSEIEIPFYMIYYVFGMTKHRDIIDSIVFGIDNNDEITVKMKEILAKAFRAKNKEFERVQSSTNPEVILNEIAKKVSDLARNPNISKDDNAEKKVRTDTFHLLDKLILPHIESDGNEEIADTPEKKAARLRNIRVFKLRYLSILINKLLKIHLGVYQQTDRDAYPEKRVHTPGIVMGKALKSRFNVLVVQEIRKRAINEFKNTVWSSVNLEDVIRAAVKPDDMEKALVQSIVTGENTINIRKHEINNRVSSEIVIPKNPGNIAAILRNIRTHGTSAAKATDRAQDMRAMHPTYYGFIGCESKDTGAEVGLGKQLGSTVIVTEASNSYILKTKLLSDKDLVHHTDISNAEMRTYTLIYVNGDWIGGCKNPREFVDRYKLARRHGQINKFVSIVWEFSKNEIKFWSDVGRLVRPLVIVYSNGAQCLRDYKAGKTDVKFRQWVKLTKKHIRGLQSGKLTIDKLVEMRVLEYISADEQQNVFLAANLDVLREDENNILRPYTHCDIEQAMFGIISLNCPMTNHTASSRVIFHGNQEKQACGPYQDNWPFRYDKNAIYQIYCNNPVVKALANAVIPPSSQNIIIAYMDNGWNQEDSLVLNQSSIDRGLFNVYRFYVEKTHLEKGESFGNNSFERTLEVKQDANYGHCDARGLIIEGTVVQKGYVLVIKKAKIQKGENKDPNYDYIDRSLIYKSNEPAIVESVIPTRNDEDVEIVKVKLRSYRPIIVGDKLSSVEGCKGILAITKKAKDMPYCEDGLVPDILINPHSVPTRMVIGQIIETMMAELAIKKGVIIDATPFKHHDIDGMMKELAEKYGIEYSGHKRMFNPKTGMWYDSLIFIGPATYRRLQKFVLDEHYAMARGPTCALTRQPLDGRLYAIA